MNNGDNFGNGNNFRNGNFNMNNNMNNNMNMGFGGFPQVSRKSRTTLVLLSFFLGGLGIDRFYAGRIGLGLCKLFLLVPTFGIWAFIDFILAICGAQRDEYGLPISQW